MKDTSPIVIITEPLEDNFFFAVDSPSSFDYSGLKQKVFPTDEEKQKRANDFDEVVANSMLSG